MLISGFLPLHFDVTLTDIEGQKAGYLSKRPAESPSWTRTFFPNISKGPLIQNSLGVM